MTIKQSIKQNLLNWYGKEPTSLDEVAECVIESVNRTMKNNSVVGFAWDIQYRESVSNTHHAPANGVTNWHCKPDLPKGYPGFYGRVWVRYKNYPNDAGSVGLRNSLTHTGSGGGGGYGGPWQRIENEYFYRTSGTKRSAYNKPHIYSWDYRFFLSDWPLIEKWVSNQQLLSSLKHNTKWSCKHSFQWDDPDTHYADSLFLEDHLIYE